MNCVVDEDLPKAVSKLLKNMGFNVFDVRDQGLRGKSDIEVFKFAQKHQAVLFTADLGFANIINFVPGSHYGICVLRFPNEISVLTVTTELSKLLTMLKASDYQGNLLILSPNLIRIRRSKPRSN